jgi:hypothetical protein
LQEAAPTTQPPVDVALLAYSAATSAQVEGHRSGTAVDVKTDYAIRELGRNGDRVFARRHDSYQQGVIEQALSAELDGVNAAIASVTRRSYSEVLSPAAVAAW